MKTITFQQQTYSVPEWANYIARDADGTVCVYETKPEWFAMASSPYGGMWREGGEWESVTPVASTVVTCEAI